MIDTAEVKFLAGFNVLNLSKKLSTVESVPEKTRSVYIASNKIKFSFCNMKKVSFLYLYFVFFWQIIYRRWACYNFVVFLKEFITFSQNTIFNNVIWSHNNFFSLLQIRGLQQKSKKKQISLYFVLLHYFLQVVLIRNDLSGRLEIILIK